VVGWRDLTLGRLLQQLVRFLRLRAAKSAREREGVRRDKNTRKQRTPEEAAKEQAALERKAPTR
jgi:hypothetical protein